MSETDERHVVIDGTVVHRPAHFWTATVQELLRHLRSAGLTSVPEPLGLDGAEETLRLIPGASGPACWPYQATDPGLRSAAVLLRKVHDATRGWTPSDGAQWAIPAREDADVVCHGDPGPWNMVWDGPTAIGLLDWDFAHPAPAIDDVAYALEYFTPFRSDDHAIRWQGFSAPPNRRHRIEVFAQAYGLAGTEGIVDAVIARQQATIGHVRELAERGILPQRTWVADGFLDTLAERVAWSQAHRDLFEPQ